MKRIKVRAPACVFLAVLFVAAGALFPRMAQAYKPPSHEIPQDFDLRKRQPKAASLSVEKTARVTELRQRIEGLQVDFDEVLGTPRRIAAMNGFLSGPNAQGGGISPKSAGTLLANDPHRSLKAFLNQHSVLFGQGAEALNSARIKRAFITPHNGVRTTIHEQQLDGIAVYEGVMLSHVTARGELISLSSQFLPNLEQAARTGAPNRAALAAAPQISPAQAVGLAASSLGEELPDIAPTAPPEGPEKTQGFTAGRMPGVAQVKLVWLPMDASHVRLCWQVEVTRRTGGERFRILIDAQTGAVLLRRCLTVYFTEATYRVFTNESPSPLLPGYLTPTTNQPPVTSRSLVALAALSTNASPLGWISDRDNETRGNNVDAHLDVNGDDKPDLPRPHGSPFRVFDFPADLTQPPLAYRDAAVVQLFYWCNWAHDQLYELGFTEAAGNFQMDNFGRGGKGGDPVQADAQDGSGVNNANFSPTDDGESPRIQMFVFDGSNPARDGDLDATIILHEFAHGLSTRLVGGGVGISSLQTSGMGEGWSDFYAITLLMEESDDPRGNFIEGGYVTYQFFGLTQNYYYGIRRFPYSTDLTKSPLTFKDIDPAQISAHPNVPVSPVDPINPLSANEVHHQGEVWCVTLGEVRANLIQKYGFAKGRRLTLQLVTDGMKLAPPNPNFLEARDAIIQADFVDNAGLDFNELWTAFAKRGMGFTATSPSSSTTAGVHEAFDLPDPLLIFPSTPFISSGPVGGPLLPGCMTYVLTNHTSNALSWSLTLTQSWLSATPAGGKLAAHAFTNVTVCLTNGGKNLAWGDYRASILFSNLTAHSVQRREAHLRVMDFASMPFVEDFESGKLQSYWMVTGTGDFRTQVTTNYGPHGGLYHVTMDSLSSDDFARNELTLGIDLGGYTNVVLRFWAKQFDEEPDGPPATPFRDGADFDGVAISQDGIAWYEVQGLRNLEASNTQWVVELDECVAAHGLGYNSTFRLRFNQYDNFSIPTDGIAIDDISISGVPARRLVVSVPQQAAEGNGVLTNQGRVTLAAPLSAPLVVSLSSSDPSKAVVPLTVTIPAGATQAAFSLTISNNSLLDGTQPIEIGAAAPGYFGQSALINVADNEKATLKLRLPRTAREGDGLLPRAGTLTVSPKPARDIIVNLSSSDTSEVQVPPTVVVPAGKSSITFDLMIVDDNAFDGTQQTTITAHVANWIDGQATMSILDNESPLLSLVVPPRTSEGNGVLTNAGVILIPGTLPTNLVVTLTSSNLAKILVPASVIIPAGSTSAIFNLTVIDNPAIDGLRSLTLVARAPGFSVATANIEVLDNETPPVPYQPTPTNLARNVSVLTALSWRGGIGEIVVNGGFETGDLTGWAQDNIDYGAFIINDGTVDPEGPQEPVPPFDGRFCVMTAQIGGGIHTLYQELLIPADATSATLSWFDRLRNTAGEFAPSNQEFRVEIRDTRNVVLAQAFATKSGDPATNDWTKRSFDVTKFRGQTIRIAFIETDRQGYFNVYIDDVSVVLGDPGQTSFDVYFGTNTVLGAAQFVGNTTNQNMLLPRLALNTTYRWRVVSRRGSAQSSGPIWQFTTRGVGVLDHFQWSAISPTQWMNQPFRATLTAKDDLNNTITNFKGSVTMSGLSGTGIESAVVVSEIDPGLDDKIEFANVSGRALNLSGWQISVYDSSAWPSPRLTFIVPTNTLCALGDVFLLNFSGKAPGVYPNFFAGTNVLWNYAALGNPIAVLLRDADGNPVDFACAANADPGQITSPLPIPADQWSGNPIPANTNINLTYQRVGKSDHNDRSDWIAATNTIGRFHPDLGSPFINPHPISLSPTNLTNFTSGIWSGEITVAQPASKLLLQASDGAGHLGFSSPCTVSAMNDLSVSLSNPPNLAIIGDELTYLVTVANSGPSAAAFVVLQDPLPAGTTLVSATASRGVCANIGGILLCNLGPLAGGESVSISIVLAANASGSLTNTITTVRPEADAYLPNNTISAVTTINLPLISIPGPPAIVNEGNAGVTNETFSVFLSTPCKLPVYVNYSTSNNTATANQDYIPASGTLVFAPGTTNRTITVQVLGDTVYELSESYFVNLFSPVNAAIAIGQTRGRILNDDAPPNLFIDNVTIAESAAGTTTTAVFTVSLAGLSGLSAVVNFATSDGTALAGTDYFATAGTLTFPPGVTNRAIPVTIIGNTLSKTNATFSVLLSDAGGAIIASSPGFCTIKDNGGVPLLTLSVNGPAVRLRFPSTPGKSYRIERADTLSAREWIPIGGDLLGTGGNLEVTDVFGPAQRTRFYRVHLLSP